MSLSWWADLKADHLYLCLRSYESATRTDSITDNNEMKRIVEKNVLKWAWFSSQLAPDETDSEYILQGLKQIKHTQIFASFFIFNFLIF